MLSLGMLVFHPVRPAVCQHVFDTSLTCHLERTVDLVAVMLICVG